GPGGAAVAHAGARRSAPSAAYVGFRRRRSPWALGRSGTRLVGKADLFKDFPMPSSDPKAKIAPLPSRAEAPPAEGLGLTHRPRRNRKSEWARRLVRENVLTTDDLI